MSHRTDRRRRKKARDRQDTPPPPTPPLELRCGKHGDVALFQDFSQAVRDLWLVRRAIRQDWDIPEPMRQYVIAQSMDIVRQDADPNASIEACTNFLEMVAADM